MKVALNTLGCKVNLYESEYITALLKENNYEIVSFEEKADIYIINTCTVTNTSDAKSRKMINAARRKNSDALIIAMGCYTQIKPEDATEADIVIGNKDKSKIIELIKEYQSNQKPIKRIYDLSLEKFESMEIKNFTAHTRAFVKIQDGCDAFCSYCIIPYTRGPIRSKPLSLVIEEITALVSNGYQEIVLTGIHTGKYGRDLQTSLTELIKEILKIPNLYRLRLSSIEINEITDELITLIKENNIIARHFHIPLQSGSAKILKLMERKYDKEYFFTKVQKLREIDPDISFTTDLIVGFPNESDDDFKETYEFLKQVKFTKIHTFPYSKRDHTKASLMPKQIPGDIKRNRVHQILELSNELEYQYNQKFLNKKVMVLTEEDHDSYTVGHTSNYLKVYIEGHLEHNKVYPILITEVTPSKILGTYQE